MTDCSTGIQPVTGKPSISVNSDNRGRVRNKSKTIVIIDDNCDKLYRHTNKMIFIKNNEVILEAPTTEAYTRVDFLSKHRFSVPSIIKLTYLARKNKGTKIIYHKDIRDLIKDIYKHV